MSIVDRISKKTLNNDLQADVLTALTIAGLHFVLLLLLQVESYFLFLFKKSDGISEAFHFLFHFPLGQLGNIFISLSLAISFLVLKRHPIFRFLSFIFISLLNFYLLVDQMIFRVFFKHFRPSLNEGRFIPEVQMFATFLDEIGPRFIFNFIVFSIMTYLLYFNMMRDRHFEWQKKSWRPNRVLGLGFLVYIVSCSAYAVLNDIGELYRHPVFSLFEERSQLSGQGGHINRLDKAVYTSQIEKTEKVQVVEGAVREALGDVKSQYKSPNIVFIVIESVGSYGMFNLNGDLNPSVTPFLSSLRNKSIYFPNVYTVHPTTSLSHVGMQTGGYGITWGSVFLHLGRPYLKPTLPSEFKAGGYKTAMISAGTLHDGNLNSFYRNLKYDFSFDFGDQNADFKKKNENGPWGGRDELLVTQLENFLTSEIQNKNQPFFAGLYTISTHYPYVVPPEYKRLKKGATDYEKYLHSLTYTDGIIAQVFSLLEKTNHLQDTIIVITGDHNEAFGDIHRDNLLHNGALFEENIKTFLMVIDPRESFQGPVFSAGAIHTGDFLPTLLSLAGMKPPQVLGQDLSSPDYEYRNIFFHKKPFPAQCGLKQGKWKFFFDIENEDSAANLYDLDLDKREQNNLAPQQTELVKALKKLCFDWYYGMEGEYRSRSLVGEDDVNETGSKSSSALKAVRFIGRDEREFVYELKSPRPYEQMFIQVIWDETPKDLEVKYSLVSPTGKKYEYDQTKMDFYTSSTLYLTTKLPLEPGLWKMKIASQGQELYSRDFKIEEGWEKEIQNTNHPGPQLSVLGRLDKHDYFHQAEGIHLQKVHPDQEELRVVTVWDPLPQPRKVRFEWVAPDGQIAEVYDFVVSAGWTHTYNYLRSPRPLKAGKWTITIKDQALDKVLLKKEFIVDPKAQILKE